jgi:hypothetical protein
MKHREKGMTQGIEMLIRDSGKNYSSDSVIEIIVRPNERLPAIDCYLVSSPYQAGGELIGERFESAIAGGNTSHA